MEGGLPDERGRRPIRLQDKPKTCHRRRIHKERHLCTPELATGSQVSDHCRCTGDRGEVPPPRHVFMGVDSLSAGQSVCSCQARACQDCLAAGSIHPYERIAAPKMASPVPATSPQEIGLQRKTIPTATSTGVADTSSREWASEVWWTPHTQHPK